MFELETNGQMPPLDVVLSALEVLDDKCNKILRGDGSDSGGGGGTAADEFNDPYYE